MPYTPLYAAEGPHPVLAIPELLDLICRQLDQSSNAANARVCKLWSAIALDTLWKDVDDLRRLFSVLAPLGAVSTGLYEFNRPLEPDDWKRFAFYSRRVRRLLCEDIDLQQSVFDEVGRTRPTLTILPNLQTLVWCGQLALSILFMHRGVKNFTIVLDEVATISPRPFFQDVVSRMPALACLDIRTNVPAHAIESDLAKLIQELPNLHKIVVPRFYFTARIAEASSQLQNLGTIEFQYAREQGCGDPDDVLMFSPNIKEGAFPSLWDLSMTITFDAAARFIDMPFAPVNLTMLYLDSSFIETPTAIHNLLAVIAENCQLLRFLCVISLQNCSVTDVGVESDYNITLDTIKPVLKLPNLTNLELVHHYPLALHQADIESLASHWPALESLVLNNEPVHLLNSNLTFDALIPFAKHCPKLTKLGLFIDATSTKSIYHPSSSPSSAFEPLPTFAALERLSMGVSIIASDQAAALALSYMLPWGCEIDSGVTWVEELEVSQEVSDEVGQRSEMWTRVRDLLPMLMELRMQERCRAAQMERELDELRRRNQALARKGDDDNAHSLEAEKDHGCVVV